ncbi:MAG: helix-turn-helix transcriptional regulator [Bacteroidota bacterium]|jgi:DNA-binding XRE family transcriptional regulator
MNEEVHNVVHFKQFEKDVVQKVVQHRKEAGLSQSKLADLINVDRRKIIDLEAGKIDFETLLKASDLLGIKIICKFEIE